MAKQLCDLCGMHVKPWHKPLQGEVVAKVLEQPMASTGSPVLRRGKALQVVWASGVATVVAQQTRAGQHKLVQFVPSLV